MDTDPAPGRRPLHRLALIRLALRTVTSAFFVLAGGLLLGRAFEARAWPTVLGTVERIEVVAASPVDEALSAPGQRYRIVSEYRYLVGGSEFRGTTVSWYDWVYPSERAARRFLAEHQLRQGARAEVSYDPGDPSRSLLVRAIPWRRVEVIAVLLLLLILPTAVIGFSVVDVIRGGVSRRDDSSRGRFW